MKPSLYHMTLCMLRIEDTEGVQEATQMMRDLEADLRTILEGSESAIRLRVGELSTFGQRVLYAKVTPEPFDAFSLVMSAIQSKVSECSDKVQPNNKFGFVPHMTLVKVNRPVARARHSKYLLSKYYEEHLHDQLGVQPFNNLHLCVIDDQTRLSDGFYHTLHQSQF